MLLTLADVLRLDALRRGKPKIAAGADRLDGRVRWVHVIEILEPAHLLRGGELVLLTGIALPDAPERLRQLKSLAEQLRPRLGEELVMGVGSSVETIRDVRRSFSEAEQVADVAVRQPDGRPYYRLPDLRLRGLLHLLRDDARLQTFVERELGRLLAYDAQHGTALVTVLSTYLECGRNKALAASRAHLSRPAFYERLHKIARILDADLDDVASCTSLHVALLALESVRGHQR